VCQELDVEVPGDVVPVIAFGFAGGFGNTGSVCGAVVGGVMAISLKQGRAETMEDSLKNLELVSEFRRRFEAEMKHIGCRELTGLDLTTAEGREQLMNSDIPMKACFPAVATAYRLALELLSEEE
jgi:C_GCAxxG_C_C family probable redox protein